MKKTLKKASELMGSSEEHIRKNIHHNDSNISFYGHSIHKKDNIIIAMARDYQSKFLLVLSSKKSGNFVKFSGKSISGDSIFAKKCPLNEHNAVVLREIFPWTAPSSCKKNCKTVIGCGDRLSIATPGHIAATSEFAVFPILLQHSIKQLKLTQRTFKEVVDDTTFLVYQSGYRNGYGADGNQLKTISDINTALAAGIPMITLDLEEWLDKRAKLLSDSEIDAAFEKLPAKIKEQTKSRYFDKTFNLKNGTLNFSVTTAKRCALMYYKAIKFALKAYNHIKKDRGDKFDFEISLTDKPWATLPEDHFYIANEMNESGIAFTSLAPKFIGNFRRGLDYKDDKKEFIKQFTVHCDIAASLGNYRISIHTGSDKFSIYPEIGKISNLRFHLKTAGTSWLQALLLIAELDPVFYRVIHQCATSNLKETAKYYNIPFATEDIPDISKSYDEELPKLVKSNKTLRQLLHISYGPVLNDASIRPLLFSFMHKHEEAYHEIIKKHFVKHFKKLGIPKKAT